MPNGGEMVAHCGSYEEIHKICIENNVGLVIDETY